MITGSLSSSVAAPIVDDVKKSTVIGKVADKLYQNNNDGAEVLGQSLTSAASIINMMQNGFDAQQLRYQLSRETTNYPWMPELVTALGDFAKNRGKYQSISDFYPQLAKVLNKYLVKEQQRHDKAMK